MRKAKLDVTAIDEDLLPLFFFVFLRVGSMTASSKLAGYRHLPPLEPIVADDRSL